MKLRKIGFGKNQWISLFLLEVFATINAGVVFQIFTRATAGMTAGSVFVLVGVLAVFRFAKGSDWLTRVGLFFALVHLLGATILLSKRLILPHAMPVTEVMGIPMQYYHSGSTYVFFALMVVTLVKVFRK